MNEKPDESANSSGPERVDASTAAAAESSQGNDALLQTLSELKAENADLRDRNLRLIAEMENFRRRSDREKADGMKYAVSDFARDVVSIGDNLRRAIEAARKEGIDQSPALKTLLEGVEVTERELIKVFERHGVTRFDPLGEKFDPHIHEAMIKVDVPNVPADIIVQVLQAGYKINERVLRPAAVIVAKGGSVTRPEPAPQKMPPETHDRGQVNGSDEGPDDHSALQPMGTDEHDPDVARDHSGAPRDPQARRRDRTAGEKRTSSMTQPVTENSGPAKKDELISSFGKRMENGN